MRGGPRLPFGLTELPDYAGVEPQVIGVMVIVTGIVAAIGALYWPD